MVTTIATWATVAFLLATCRRIGRAWPFSACNDPEPLEAQPGLAELDVWLHQVTTGETVLVTELGVVFTDIGDLDVYEVLAFVDEVERLPETAEPVA